MGENTRNNAHSQDLVTMVTVNQHAYYYYCLTNTCQMSNHVMFLGLSKYFIEKTVKWAPQKFIYCLVYYIRYSSLFGHWLS